MWPTSIPRPSRRRSAIGGWFKHLAREWTIESWRSMLPAFARPEPSTWTDETLTAAWLVLDMRGATINAMVLAGLVLALAVVIDDAHAAGFLGKTGRGTHEHCGVMGKIDIITGTLGKALGGASGGFTSARKHIVELLRQRSRPYLFSNSVAPPIVAVRLEATGTAT